MTRRCQRPALGFFLLFLAARPAFANAGTPLMWLEIFHLTIGNILIGLLEGLIIAWVFRVLKGRAFSRMIPANFASAFLGLALFRFLGWLYDQKIFVDEPLYHITQFVVCLALLSFPLSVLIEWPFIASALQTRKRPWRDGLAASLLVQMLSYCLLGFLYLDASTPGTRVDLIPDRNLLLKSNNGLIIYYYSPADRGIYEMLPESGEKRRIVELEDDTSFYNLILEQDPASNSWNLCVNDGRSATSEVVVKKVPIRLASTRRQYIDRVATLFEHGTSKWTVLDEWGVLGWEEGEDGERKNYFRLAFEYPFLRKQFPSHGTHVEGDYIVCELADRIVLFEIETRRFRVLAEGRAPVVAFLAEEQPPPPPAPVN